MKKRFVLLGILLIFALGAVIFIAGCSEESDNVSGRTVITVWSGQAGSKAAYTRLIDEWNRTQGKEKGIYIRYEVFASTEYNQKLFAAMKNKTTPEIFRVPGSKRSYAEEGQIVPIESFPGGKDFIEGYGEPLLEGREQFSGKTYFVNGEVTTYALIYNKDMFRKYKIVDASGEPKVPQTMSEYTETARKLTHPEDGCYGIGLPIKTTTFAGPMFYGPFSSCIPLRVNYDEGTRDFTAYRKAFEWLGKIREEKSYFPGAEILDNDMMRSQFAAGRIGMFIGASWDVGVLTDQFPTECDWGVAPMPLVDGYERVASTASATSGFCIGPKALKGDRKKVMEVFSFLHSPELQRKLYEAGAAIPRVPQVMKGADLSNTPPQWAGFASQYTEIPPRYEIPDISSRPVDMKECIDSVWTEEKTVDEVIKAYEDAFRTNFIKAVDNGTLDVEKAKEIQKNHRE